MLKATYRPYVLQFKNPILTSRGGMQVKNGYYLQVSNGPHTGIGECSFIEGLSPDPLSTYPDALQHLCAAIETENVNPDNYRQYPSLLFAYETALLDLSSQGRKILFESAFTQGQQAIPINGLLWMGSKEFILQQLHEKLKAGFTCLKLKVGALPFEEELEILRFIRQQYGPSQIEIRLDANGAFTADDVFKKLEQLAAFGIHSIEQPVKQGQWPLMAKVCAQSPIPIALDEELIGIPPSQMGSLLSKIKPAYIILKPSLLGGLIACNQWIAQAVCMNIGWWATSALESNIGLNAIAQWVFTFQPSMVQGLGTGSLYTNNVASPLVIENGMLHYRPQLSWASLPPTV